MNDTNYEVYIFCSNCLVHKKIEVPKGSLINQTVCPNCGNLTLEIDPNGEIFSRPPSRPNYR